MGEVLWTAKRVGMYGEGWAWLALDQSVDESVNHLQQNSFEDVDASLVQGILKVQLKNFTRHTADHERLPTNAATGIPNLYHHPLLSFDFACSLC